MRFGVPNADGSRTWFALVPVPLQGGGWAWLEWVGMTNVYPRACGITGTVRQFFALEPKSKELACQPKRNGLAYEPMGTMPPDRKR